MKRGAIFAVVCAILWPCAVFAADSIVIGGKIFTESYVLGEIAAQTIESASPVPVTRKLGMGSTGILFEALKSGAIDVYPDYTGTLAEAILKRPELKSLDEIRRDDPSFVAGHWRQRGTLGIRTITGGVHQRIRHALQICVDGDAATRVANTAHVQREIV